jgi:hypothetical protein
MSRISWFLGAAIVVVAVTAAHDMFADTNAESSVNKKDQAASIVPSKIESPEADNLNPQQAFDISATTSTITPDVVALWVIAANNSDSTVQSTTDDALANVPRAIVLPALRKIMTNGGESERQSALNALHRLALKQGDANGEIKNILRLTSYDGDDVFAVEAQLALEDVERSTDAKVPIQSQPEYP